MKKKEEIKYALKIYNGAVKHIIENKLSRQRSRNFLDKLNLLDGVCNILPMKERVWIKRNCKTTSMGSRFNVFTTFWGKVPRYADTRNEMIECLTLRIDILKKELKLCR